VFETKILGIDPGSYKLGLGLLEKSGNNLRLLFAETISAPKTLPMYERLDYIVKTLNKRLDDLCPSEVAIEDSFFASNTKNAFRLGIVRGVMVAACLFRGIKIYEYAPAEIKASITGYGRADKEQIKKMVSLCLGKELRLGTDATDAVAVAMCHATRRKWQ